MREADRSEEAAHLFRCFARHGEACDEIAREYDDACRELAVEPDALTQRLVEARADLVAAEFARRRLRGRNGLTQRALVMLSLLEARPEFTGRFLLPRPSAAGAWLTLVVAPLEAGYRFAKGAVLLWWHGRGL